MTFQIRPLPRAAFEDLLQMSDADLATTGAVARIADTAPGFPCRVSLRDAEPGERVLLLNFEHRDADTPFRARHAIYVRADAIEAHPQPGEVPEVLRRRVLSVRAFDAAGWLRDADIADGAAVEPVIERLLADLEVAYLHLHYAKPGCYAARVERG